jgi:TolA-binding protein
MALCAMTGSKWNNQRGFEAMRHLLIAAVLFSGVSTAPLFAQSSDVIPLRVDRLEKEMRAVQRKVFPNGAAIEPEIGGNGGGATIGSPSGTPITDLTARVDALEAQLKSLTGQSEQNGFRIKKLEEAMKASEARLKALEPAEPIVEPPPAPAAAVVAPKPAPIVTAAALKPAPKPVAITKPAAPTVKAAAPAKPDPKRKGLIEAVEIPATGDATEDSYSYGYRLWQAKLYPEAQIKFKEFVAKHPTHKRASYAQNLLGRAYLDEGKPALASVAFYDNYQKMPRGERASESLYWLGVSLNKLNKPADACKAYKEFSDVYGERAPADLKAKVTKGKADAKCTA